MPDTAACPACGAQNRLDGLVAGETLRCSTNPWILAAARRKIAAKTAKGQREDAKKLFLAFFPCLLASLAAIPGCGSTALGAVRGGHPTLYPAPVPAGRPGPPFDFRRLM